MKKHQGNERTEMKMDEKLSNMPPKHIIAK